MCHGSKFLSDILLIQRTEVYENSNEKGNFHPWKYLSCLFFLILGAWSLVHWQSLCWNVLCVMKPPLYTISYSFPSTVAILWDTVCGLALDEYTLEQEVTSEISWTGWERVLGVLETGRQEDGGKSHSLGSDIVGWRHSWRLGLVFGSFPVPIHEAECNFLLTKLSCVLVMYCCVSIHRRARVCSYHWCCRRP